MIASQNEEFSRYETFQTPAASRLLASPGGTAATLTANSPGTWGNDLTVEVADATQNPFVRGEEHPGGAAVSLSRTPALASPRNRIRLFRAATGATSDLEIVTAAPPTGTVTVTRTFDGAAGAPAAFASLDAFLDAVSGPAPSVRHASVGFASVVDFLAAVGAAGVPVALGDWDEDGVLDLYVPHSRSVVPPLRLATAADRLEIAYGAAALDQPAVVYLRATRG